MDRFKKDRFGSEYLGYKKKTSFLIPGIRVDSEPLKR